MVEPVKAPPKEQSADDKKTLKKLLDAHIEVAEHKLGRPPSMEELQGMLADTPAESENSPTPTGQDMPQPGEHMQSAGVSSELDKADEGNKSDLEDEPQVDEPKILHIKIYHGMGDEVEGQERQPDPDKILFYENPIDGQCFDCANQEWLSERPNVLDHLPARPIRFDEKDIVAAIANGVMDDGDFSALKSKGMIGETPDRLWGLTKKLQTQVEELEKSDDPELDENEDDEPIDPDFESDGTSGSGGTDVVADYFKTAGVSMDPEELEEMMSAEGADSPFAQIMRIALARAMTGMEDRIREIVREEMQMTLDAYGESDEEPQYDEPLVGEEVELEGEVDSPRVDNPEET